MAPDQPPQWGFLRRRWTSRRAFVCRGDASSLITRTRVGRKGGHMMGWNRLGACSSVLLPSMVVSCVNYTRIVMEFPASSRHRSRCRRMDGRARVQATGRATRQVENPGGWSGSIEVHDAMQSTDEKDMRCQLPRAAQQLDHLVGRHFLRKKKERA